MPVVADTRAMALHYGGLQRITMYGSQRTAPHAKCVPYQAKALVPISQADCRCALLEGRTAAEVLVA